MTPLILLILMFGLPLFLVTVLRINPLFLFVSIVSGYLWSLLLGDTTELVVGSLIQTSHTDVISRVGLLMVPFVLTLLFLRKTLSTSALPFYFTLLVMDSLLLVTLLLAMLTPGVQGAIYQTHLGDTLRQAHDLIIAGVAAMQLVVMYVFRPRSKHSKHHK